MYWLYIDIGIDESVHPEMRDDNPSDLADARPPPFTQGRLIR